ncbi:MAG: arylesterase [Pseudomonadota bacterium]
MLGDSISAGYGIQSEEGWVHLLQQALAHEEYPWHAVNASISGETTGGGLARLPGVMDAHKPGIVIIELGGNDGLRGYPISRMRENLAAMVSLVQSYGALPIVVSMRIPPNYGPRYTRAFDAVFADVAEQTNASLVPFILEDVALDRKLMQDDGIHPTAAAQPLLLDAIWPYLQPHL